MKYFVVEPDSESGILQLTDHQVTVRDDGSLQYKHPETDLKCTVKNSQWSNDWDKIVHAAYEQLNKKIAYRQKQLEQLEQARNQLLEASPELKRSTSQMNLFG
jgi:hypothetical protein